MSAGTAVRRSAPVGGARRLHPIAGAVAMLAIAGLLSTVAVVELFGSTGTLIEVRLRLPWALLVLVPALAATVSSGERAAGRRRGPRLEAKRRRARWVAANGLLVLVPAVLWLAWKAGRGEIDASFAVVQGVEFVAGFANLVLLGASARDGLALSGRRPIRAPRRARALGAGR